MENDLITVRYVGGVALTMVLPSLRELDVVPGETYEVMPFEAAALLRRLDFTEE